MWNRVDLKERAKVNFKKSYWAAVAVAFIWTVVSALTMGGTSNTVNNSINSGNSGVGTEPGGVADRVTSIITQHPAIAVGFVGVLIGIAVIGVIIKLFVGYQIEVGKNRFFIENSYSDNARVGLVLSTYQNGSMVTVAWTRFLMDLFTGLWTLLLIIPGIIKSYEYKMIPYILADNPQVDRRTAFEQSKQMTYGHKMDLFILDLSFLGWNILAIVTCGIVGIFYAIPYYEQTMAEVYETLR